MIRNGNQYRDGLRDGREVWIDGEKVKDVTQHPALKPIVDARARIHDMQFEAEFETKLTYSDDISKSSIFYKPPRSKEDWKDKRLGLTTVLHELGGVISRFGDETVGELWSLLDGKDVLAECEPQFAENIDRHVQNVIHGDLFLVSANTDPKGDRSKPPQEQDPDMLLHVVKETDAGIIIRGAKYETAAGYADWAFVKPTVGPWAHQALSDYAVGCMVPLGAPNVKHIARSGFAGREPTEDAPLANRFDEVDFLVVFDNVFVPWEDVFFRRHTRSAQYMRTNLTKYSAFAFTSRALHLADLLIGTVLWNTKQTGVDKLQAVQENISTLICYRETINAHLTAAIEDGFTSPAGLHTPNQSLLYAGRQHACYNLPRMLHIARELCGGQICLTPSIDSFSSDGAGPWLQKFYSLNESWEAEDRRKLLALAKDLVNSGHAGQKASFLQFAQASNFLHLGAVFSSFDSSPALNFSQRAAGMSDRIRGTLR